VEQEALSVDDNRSRASGEQEALFVDGDQSRASGEQEPSQEEENYERNSDSLEDEDSRFGDEHHDEIPEPPPEVGETDVKLMDLYPVHTPERIVEATITSDGDSLTVTGTDLREVTASIISSQADSGCFIFHSAMSANRIHANTRFAVAGTRNQFEPKLYGKPCRSAALTKFRNLELFRVSNRSISFILSVYILHQRIPKSPRFFDSWVTIISCAFNVARLKPDLSPSYCELSPQRQGQYGEAMTAMLPFECLKGSNQRKAEIKDTVTDIPHEIGLDFVSVFWDVIKSWAELPDDLDEDQKQIAMDKYGLDQMMYGERNEVFSVLDIIPTFALSLTKEAIFSARAVGIKSAWQLKPCSVVHMNDADAVRNTLVAHTAVVHKQAKKLVTHVEGADVIIALDVGHVIAPTTDFTSFVCLGPGLATFAKANTDRTKTAEVAQRNSSIRHSVGESAPAVPF
jgi:hypothetical protein